MLSWRLRPPRVMLKRASCCLDFLIKLSNVSGDLVLAPRSRFPIYERKDGSSVDY